MADLTPRFEDVQSHYDLSDDFYRLFLDPTQTYSGAYFECDDMTLEEAQVAEIDLSLGKLGLQPGMTLLDIGCGWGATIRRAVERYDVNVVGLTLSENQHDHAEKALAALDSPRSMRVLLEGWEQFDEPVDRIVSIGAFEHFGHDRHDDFFAMAYRALPDDGVMLLHTVTRLALAELKERHTADDGCRAVRQLHLERDLPRRAPADDRGHRGAGDGRGLHGRPHPVAAVSHYARTLETWAKALEAQRDEAIAVQSEEVYHRYMRYLTGCADMFRKGYIDVNQLTLQK